jgi:hypothetical protein
MKHGLPLILLLCLAAGTARADIDHLCLNKCISDSGSATTCLSACTVAQAPAVSPATPVPKATDTGAGANRVLPVPTPVKQGTLLPSAPVATAKPEKDYICVRACLADHNSYGYCEKTCSKTCPPAAVLCPSPVYKKR